MKRLLFLLTILLAAKQQSGAQTNPLHVGDKLPENFVFTEMLGHPSGSLSPAALSSRLVILDIWSPFCSVCIAQLPKLSALQQRFGADVAIIPVGIQMPASDARSFYTSRIAKNPAIRLPTAIVETLGRDSVFKQLFPYRGLPHVIWLNSERRIISITGYEEVTAGNISQILDGKQPALKQKVFTRKIDANSPFLIPLQDGGHQTHFGSLFGPQTDTLAHNLHLHEFTKDNYRRYVQVNRTWQNLYLMAYQRRYGLDWWPGASAYKRMIIDTTATMPRDEIQYGYELILESPVDDETFFYKMIRDLDQHFGVQSELTKRSLACLAITPARQTNLKKRQMAPGEGMTAERLVDRLNYQGKGIAQLVVNHCPPESRYRVVVRENYDSIETLAADLREAGLEVRPVTLEMDVIYIR